MELMTTKDVRKIVEDYLIANKHDGLYRTGCTRGGCLLRGNLLCTDFSEHCTAGYEIRYVVCKTCLEYEVCAKLETEYNVQEGRECKRYIETKGR